MAVSKELTQSQADKLMRMEKRQENSKEYWFPGPGQKYIVPLISVQHNENFSLDLYKGKMVLKMNSQSWTSQNRTSQNVILARLDFGGRPHTNPGGEKIECPHLHVYRENYGDKYAQTLPSEHFSDLKNPRKIFLDFLLYCRISEVHINEPLPYP